MRFSREEARLIARLWLMCYQLYGALNYSAARSRRGLHYGAHCRLPLWKLFAAGATVYRPQQFRRSVLGRFDAEDGDQMIGKKQNKNRRPQVIPQIPTFGMFRQLHVFSILTIVGQFRIFTQYGMSSPISTLPWILRLSSDLLMYPEGAEVYGAKGVAPRPGEEKLSRCYCLFAAGGLRSPYFLASRPWKWVLNFLAEHMISNDG